MNISKTAFLHALGILLYISLVGTLMSHGDSLFGHEDNAFFTPIAVLALFTLSASVVGALVLGKPLQMYLDTKKKEAVALFMQTVGWLAGFTFVLLAILIFTK